MTASFHQVKDKCCKRMLVVMHNLCQNLLASATAPFAHELQQLLDTLQHLLRTECCHVAGTKDGFPVIDASLGRRNGNTHCSTCNTGGRPKNESMLFAAIVEVLLLLKWTCMLWHIDEQPQN